MSVLTPGCRLRSPDSSRLRVSRRRQSRHSREPDCDTRGTGRHRQSSAVPIRKAPPTTGSQRSAHWLRPGGDRHLPEERLGARRACRLPRARAGRRLVVLSNYATADMRRKCTELGADRCSTSPTRSTRCVTYCQRLAAHQWHASRSGPTEAARRAAARGSNAGRTGRRLHALLDQPVLQRVVGEVAVRLERSSSP